MYLVLGTLIFGVILAATGIGATFVTKRALVPGAFAALLAVNALAVLGTGVLMRAAAMQQVEVALASVEPKVEAELRKQAETEAAALVQLGGMACSIPATLALLLGLIAAKRRATVSA